MSVLHAIAQQVGLDNLVPSDEGRSSLRAEASTWSKPLIQFLPFPLTLDVARFREPLSTSNPDGDARAAYAFAQLVDPLPSLGELYTAGLGSTAATYGQLVAGARGSTESAFARQVCRDAQLQYQKAAHATMDGIPREWRLVEAVPADWMEIDAPGRYKELSLDLSHRLEGRSDFALLEQDRPLGLALAGRAALALDPATHLKSLRMRYLLVQLRRPWLNSLLFETSGWYLEGQPDGYCSSGTLEGNMGVLPLLPSALLLATDVAVDAAWGPKDERLLAECRARNETASLGPLPLVTREVAAPGGSVQIMAWVSLVVPRSPRVSGRTNGVIVVENRGAFVVRFVVEWTQSGQAFKQTSANLLVLAAEKIAIPADVSQASLTIEVMTCPPPFETWRAVVTRSVEASAKKRFVVSGTTGHTNIEEQAP